MPFAAAPERAAFHNAGRPALTALRNEKKRFRIHVKITKLLYAQVCADDA
jgi:hypothetical protein